MDDRLRNLMHLAREHYENREYDQAEPILLQIVPSMHTRSGARGRPPPNGWVFTCSGKCISISAHSSSGMRQSSGTGRSFIDSPRGYQLQGKQVQLHAAVVATRQLFG